MVTHWLLYTYFETSQLKIFSYFVNLFVFMSLMLLLLEINDNGINSFSVVMNSTSPGHVSK